MALRVRAGAKPTRYRGTSSGAELASLDATTAAPWGPIVVLPREGREGGGGEGIRTPDPCDANAVLSH